MSNTNGTAHDPWARLRQLRDAEHEAERAWQAAREEEQRLKRLLKAASARVAAFIDTGEEAEPLYDAIEGAAAAGPLYEGLHEPLNDVVRQLDRDRPLPVSVDGGPASADGATAAVPCKPVKIAANLVTDGPEAAASVMELFPAARPDLWPPGVLPSQAMLSGVKTVADAAALDITRPHKGLSQPQVQALCRAAMAHLRSAPELAVARARCVKCHTEGREVAQPSAFVERTDVTPLDMCDLDLVGAPLGVAEADTPHTFVCAKCHAALIEPVPVAKPAKKGKGRKAKPLPSGIMIVPVEKPQYVEGTCSSCERPDCTTLDPATRRCGYCRSKEAAEAEGPPIVDPMPPLVEPKRQIHTMLGGELKPATCSVKGCRKPAVEEIQVPLNGNPGIVSTSWRCGKHRSKPEATKDCGDEGPGGTACTKERGHTGPHRWEAAPVPPAAPAIDTKQLGQRVRHRDRPDQAPGMVVCFKREGGRATGAVVEWPKERGAKKAKVTHEDLADLVAAAEGGGS